MFDVVFYFEKQYSSISANPRILIPTASSSFEVSMLISGGLATGPGFGRLDLATPFAHAVSSPQCFATASAKSSRETRSAPPIQ